MAKKKILFIIGSPNQTSQMHQISEFLPEYDCYFSQFFTDSKFAHFLISKGLFDQTILAGKFRRNSESYLEKHGLNNDYMGEKYQDEYEMVVVCNDLLYPKFFKSKKTVYVQEGMIDKLTWWTKVVRFFKLPRYLTIGTQLNGSSNYCDIFCVASDGYKDYLSKMGTEREKIVVTGIPNYDNAKQYLNNDFPHHNYVMVATTDFRETFRNENRVGFIKECVEIAKGRQLLFKLHPNEVVERAVAEIRANAPKDTLIFWEGNTEHMIANCQELITQYSTVVYTGMALGKKVHSYFNLEELKRLAPIQNNGTSAWKIAQLCKTYLKFDGDGKSFLKSFKIPERELEDCCPMA
ncbi:MAG: hypothetical protein AAF502_17050 [Bacteroidota bacterium]